MKEILSHADHLLRRSELRDSRKSYNRIILFIALMGLVVRLYQLALPGHLFGVTEYDDGVYFGAALRLVQGVLPYKDYVLVQPPGIAVIMAPIALFAKIVGTADAMAIARVATTLVDVGNIFLLGCLLRHKGRIAVAVGCAFLAFYPEAVASSQTVLLEPYLCFFSLLALLAIFEGDHVSVNSKKLLLGGVLLGIAGSVKAWAVIPAAVVMVVLAWDVRRNRNFRSPLHLTLGMIVGIGAMLGPFVAFAPAAFFHDVIYVQLSRSPGNRVGFLTRLKDIGGSGPFQWFFGFGDIVALVLLSILILVMVLAILETISEGSQFGKFAILTSLAVFVALIWPSEFYYHYADFIAPYLALTFAYGVAGTKLRQRWPFATIADSKVAKSARLVTLLLVGSLSIGYESQLHGAPLPMKSVDAVIPNGACVVSDHTSLLIASNRFFSHRASCPKMIDSFGTALSISGGETINGGASRSPRVVSYWLSDLRRADYIWLAPGNERRLPWTPVTASYFHSHFVEIASGSSIAGAIYRRKG